LATEQNFSGVIVGDEVARAALQGNAEFDRRSGERFSVLPDDMDA
jgi:glutamate synthase domain-containing protein 3